MYVITNLEHLNYFSMFQVFTCIVWDSRKCGKAPREIILLKINTLGADHLIPGGELWFFVKIRLLSK